MFSYHPKSPDVLDSGKYSNGFKTTETVNLLQVAAGICKYVWSPIIWREGRRSQENFLSSSWCVLDFDQGLTIAEAQRIFADKIHLIGTTKSHQVAKGNSPACDRFRVILKFSSPINNLRLYRYNMEKMIDLYGSDKSCKDGARFFFPCKKIVSCVTSGDVEDVKDIIPNNFEKNFHKFSPVYSQTKTIPRWLEKEFSIVQSVGMRNNWVYSRSRVLFECGYSESDALAEFLHSATYRGGVTSEVLRDIKSALHSAYKKN